MAKKKSAKYPHQWSDGSFHSITEEQHIRNRGTPIAPPPGSYDPSLDVQEGQATRGLRYLGEDVDLGRERALEDYAFGSTAYDVQGARSKQDYETAKALTERGYGRNLADLQTAAAQGEQDYGTNLSNLIRNYQRLGTSQAGEQRKAGAMAGSGANIQAARKRAENQAIEKAPIDVAYNRFTEANRLAQGRLGEDKQSDLEALALQLKRGGEDIDVGRGGLVTGYGRNVKDLGRQLTRAQDENVFLGQDIAKLRQYQADTPVIFRPGSSTPGAGAAVPGRGALGGQPSSLTAGPNAPRQPGAVRNTTRRGRKRTYTTRVTTA